MPESIDPKAIYSSTHIANLLGTTEQHVVEAFRAGMLKGRAIGNVWYCSGKSLLNSLSTATAIPSAEPVTQQPPDEPSPAPAQKAPAPPPSVAAETAPSAPQDESLPTDTQDKKRYLAKQVEQAIKKTGNYNAAADWLNQQGVPSLSGDPWSHRSVGNVLRWWKKNKR